MKTAFLVRVLGALAAVLLLGAPRARATDFHGLHVEPPKAIAGAILTDQNGTAIRFPIQDGRWQLVFFGYTRCPDVCPVTLQKVAHLLRALGSQAEQLVPWFLGIDAEGDRPETIKAFVHKFDSRIQGLSGDIESMQAMANAFGVLTRRFQGKTSLAYTLEHSSFLYLLDPEGRVRLMYPATADVSAMAEDLRRLLGAKHF